MKYKPMFFWSAYTLFPVGIFSYKTFKIVLVDRMNLKSKA